MANNGGTNDIKSFCKLVVRCPKYTLCELMRTSLCIFNFVGPVSMH